MRRMHIIGGKNHGKTTLVVELVAELTRRGLRVDTFKHTHHHHELDVPGKDSHRHREASAAVVGILTPSLNAAFWTPPSWPDRPGPIGDARYDQFDAAFAACDLVLVEGDTQTRAPQLEVWRAACSPTPLAAQLPNVRAIVKDDIPVGAWKLLPRSRVDVVADFVLEESERE
jgi:molybdopterin-guanine dinucleotide biosynthesis protein MobB